MDLCDLFDVNKTWNFSLMFDLGEVIAESVKQYFL